MPHKCIQVSEAGFLGSTYTKTGKVLTTAAAVFVACSTERASVTQGLFWWVQAQGRSPHAPGMAKNTFGPVGIPLISGTSGARQYPPPPKGVKARGDSPLRLEEISGCQDTCDQISTAASTAGRSTTQQLEKRSGTTAAALSTSLVLD